MVTYSSAVHAAGAVIFGPERDRFMSLENALDGSHGALLRKRFASA
ncbi:MAG: hypothetical protein HYU36_18980 [Planctomycetes bacterium]|nr:hypothetical protein [Planctomycetota bacterium]